MKPFGWSPEKNDALQAERGVSFESMVVAIQNGGLQDVLAHPDAQKYPRQRVLVLAHDQMRGKPRPSQLAAQQAGAKGA